MTKQTSKKAAPAADFSPVTGDHVLVCNSGTDNNPLTGEVGEVVKGWYRILLDEPYTREMDGKEVDEVSARLSSLQPVGDEATDEEAEENEQRHETRRQETRREADQEGDEEEQDGDAHSKMAEALRKARTHYVKALRPDGTNTAHCGDLIAKVLLESEPLEVCSFADTICEEHDGYHATRYASLNNGQKRMNSGNKIRAHWRKAVEANDTVQQAMIAGVLGIDAELDEIDAA